MDKESILIKPISNIQELHHLKIQPSKNYNLKKLQKWLEFELSGSVLLFLSYAFGFTILLAIIAAVLFLPLLIKVLIRERRYGWIITFLIVVIGPGVVSYFFFGQAVWLSSFTNYVTSVMVSLMFFYFYCATLRLVIPDWYHEEEDELIGVL